MTAPSLPMLLLGALIVLFGGALLWGVSRRYRRDLGARKGKREKGEDVTFIIDAFHNVTKELKEKEKELERLKALAERRAENIESYNENVLQCVTSGVITFDDACRVITFNRAAEEILGIGREQALGKNCPDIFGAGAICEDVRGTIELKQPSARMEAALDRRGSTIWLGFNTALLSDRQGAALGVILSFSDLTEVKRLHEQVELRERLTALGEMSTGIAHELRNPMAVISGYVNLLSKKDSGSNREIIRDIQSEINGMNRIIGDLLTFARPTSLNRVKVNVKEVLETCLATVLQTKDAEANITTRLDLEDMVLSLDEVLMRQAFSNLIQNAVEAMPDGGTISIEARGGGEPTIVIRDTGEGIRRDDIKKVFLPFFTTKDKGTGLGLALVHKIVLSHGGRIEAESPDGKGAAFTITLPKG